MVVESKNIKVQIDQRNQYNQYNLNIANYGLIPPLLRCYHAGFGNEFVGENKLQSAGIELR